MQNLSSIVKSEDIAEDVMISKHPFNYSNRIEYEPLSHDEVL